MADVCGSRRVGETNGHTQRGEVVVTLLRHDGEVRVSGLEGEAKAPVRTHVVYARRLHRGW